MRVGIVGNEAAKFTAVTEALARQVIRKLLKNATAVVSGGCHLGGIDIWAEEEADKLGIEQIIFPPASLDWSNGYKPRNMLIAENSDIVHCLAIAKYPPSYDGMRFDYCYHCKTDDHIKSGGCWTVKYARQLGTPGQVHVIHESRSKRVRLTRGSV